MHEFGEFLSASIEDNGDFILVKIEVRELVFIIPNDVLKAIFALPCELLQTYIFNLVTRIVKYSDRMVGAQTLESFHIPLRSTFHILSLLELFFYHSHQLN